MFRIRQLIPFLDYADLTKKKILPKKKLFTRVAKGGKFSTIAEKMGYSEFGLFMELIVQEAIVCKEEPLEDLFEGLREHIPDEVQRYYKPKEYVDVGKLVREHFGDEIPTFEPEWPCNDNRIFGHPDVVSGDCVYDIKTTGRFNAMRVSTIFQILSYYCLAHINNLDVNHVGLILPSQLKIFKVDLEGWNWKPFWKKVCECIALKKERESLYALPLLEYNVFQMRLEQVGTHVEKKHLSGMLKYNVPLQFFIGGRVSTKTTSLTKKLTESLKNRFYPPIFVHAPYNINLSKPKGVRPQKEDDKLDIPWTCYQTREILRTGEMAGVNGVVVHCGKMGGLSEEDAIKGMYESLCCITKFIPDDGVCPLLLETSSGQCGELLCDPHDFSEFYNSLPEDVRSKIKVCVDTCHTFAAGTCPMEFIEVLERNNIPIALIHYNDSKVKKGSKRDRHARIGAGYIGIKPLFNVLMWANDNNVPCVHE